MFLYSSGEQIFVNYSILRTKYNVILTTVNKYIVEMFQVMSLVVIKYKLNEL